MRVVYTEVCVVFKQKKAKIKERQSEEAKEGSGQINEKQIEKKKMKIFEKAGVDRSGRG